MVHPVDTSQVLTKAVLSASHLLGLDDSALANAIGLNSAELSRLAQGVRSLEPNSTEGLRALQLIQLSRVLGMRVGMECRQLRAWMHSYNQALGGVPEGVIQTPEGLAATLAYLERMEAPG